MRAPLRRLRPRRLDPYPLSPRRARPAAPAPLRLSIRRLGRRGCERRPRQRLPSRRDRRRRSVRPMFPGRGGRHSRRPPPWPCRRELRRARRRLRTWPPQPRSRPPARGCRSLPPRFRRRRRRRAGALPATRPEAIAGPKIPSPSKVRLARTRLMAPIRSGSCPAAAARKSSKKPEPIPTITARTMILMPEETTLPSTRSARKPVRFHSANGTSTKPASVVSLNSMMVMKSWMERMKKARMTTSQLTISTAIVRKFSKKAAGPRSRLTCSRSGLAESNPVEAMNPGRSRSSAVSRPPPAVIPRPAKDLKMMSARLEKLPIIKAKAPT